MRTIFATASFSFSRWENGEVKSRVDGQVGGECESGERFSTAQGGARVEVSVKGVGGLAIEREECL